MTSEARDQEVEDLVASYVDRMNRGERLTAEQIQENHPDLAEEILDHLETFVDLPSQSDDNGNQPLGTLGDYTLRRQIGRGGMGTVYDAWQNSMDRRVALKVMPRALAADTRTATRFIREAQIAGKLDHPNVVHVHGTGVEQQVPYYAMEFVEGETLAQILVRIKDAEPEAETPFGPKDDIRYFGQLAAAFADVADGLQHAHSKGVTHRDIKPSNLIRDGEGRLRILDFGLARLEGQDSLTLSGDVVGTPLYMSPEQARRKKIPVDHRTDVYSLGATMYEALCGRTPFRGRDHADTLSQIIERDPVEPRKVNPRVPKDLETIALKCLRKDAGDRYGTAEALAQDLRRFVRGDPIEARSEPTIEKVTRRLWRHRFAVAGACIVLLVGFIGLAIANVVIARARDQARYDLYVSDMQLAMAHWESGNLNRFATLLARHVPVGKPDLRGWEWRYLKSLEPTALLTIEADLGRVNSVDWSSDDRFLATGGADGIVKVWDAGSGALIWSRDGEHGAIDCLQWHPETRQVLAAACADHTIEVLDLSADDAVVHSMAGEAPLAWSPNGKWLAGTRKGRKGSVRIWDTAGWRDLKTPSLSLEGEWQLPAISWSPDNRYLAAGLAWPPEIIIWDTSSWKRFSLSFDDPVGGWVCSLSWSPDATRLASGFSHQRVRVWQTDAWKQGPELVFDSEARPLSLAWSPDRRRVSLAWAGGDGIVRIRDLTTKEESIALFGHSGVTSLAWSADGGRIASSSRDGSVKIWRSDGGRKGSRIRITGENPAAWSPDGLWLAVEAEAVEAKAGMGTARVLDALTGEIVYERQLAERGEWQSLAFSPDSRLLAMAGKGHVEVWDWQANALQLDIPSASYNSQPLSWSRQGLLAFGAFDFTCPVWDVRGGERVAVLKHRDQRGDGVKSVAWSPDGSRLATTSSDQVIKIWDSRSWQETQRLYRHRSSRAPAKHDLLTWSPLGERIASGNSEGELIVWDTSSWEEIYRVRGHGSNVLCVSWSPDGARIATAGDDRTVRIWDAEIGEELLKLRGHRFYVASLAWHPDGKRLLSADGSPNSVRIWDATAGYEE